MSTTASLRRSILLTVIGLCAFQVLLVGLVAVSFRVRPTTVRAYLLILLGAHTALLAFLWVMRRDFWLLEQGRQLDRVNLPNLLTLSRISSTPTVLYLLILSERYDIVPVMIVFTSLVFLTDLFDGRVSRRRHQRTRIGRYLDSMSDYAILGAVSIAFLHHGLISVWFFVLILIRLMAMGLGMGVLLLLQGSVDASSTWWGKASVFTMMLLLAASLLELVVALQPQIVTATDILEMIVAAVVVISALEKGTILYGNFRKLLHRDTT